MQGQPAKCTQITALVRGDKTLAIVCAEILPESDSTSENTGTTPAFTTHEIDAINVRGITTTSSPGPTPRALRATSKAKVPLASATA